MRRKKTPEQLEFEKTVTYKRNVNGVLRPTKLFSRKKETKHRSTFGKKRATTKTKRTFSIVLEETMYNRLQTAKGTKSLNAYINKLIADGLQA